MKESFKSKSVIIQLVIYCAITAILFTVYTAIYFVNDREIFAGDFVFLFIAVVLFAIGFIASDLTVVRYRRKTKNWADKIPDDIRLKAWRIRTPFYLSAAFALLITLVTIILLQI